MNRRQAAQILLGAVAFAALPWPAFAQQGTNRPLWGQEMLTNQERNQFHLEMRNAKSEQERVRVRNQHQELIHQRAQERGIDIPPAAGRGQGMGQGQGRGQGQGQGQGKNMQNLPRKKGGKGKFN